MVINTYVGVKHDAGKAVWSLVPWEAMEEVTKVLKMGANKYAPDNWKVVPGAERRYRDASMRHLVEMMKERELDSESGLPHAAHLACNALFLLHFHLQRSENQNLPETP